MDTALEPHDPPHMVRLTGPSDTHPSIFIVTFLLLCTQVSFLGSASNGFQIMVSESQIISKSSFSLNVSP